jgi:hypothetical protein
VVLKHIKEWDGVFLLKLQGDSPCHLEDFDGRGWEEQCFLVHKGYGVNLHQSDFSKKSKLWDNICHQDGLPKVNIYF